MSSSATRDRLLRRAQTYGIQVPEAAIESFVKYFDLLQHWNRTINLTSLRDEDEAVDRLLIEPLSAAAFLGRGGRLLDVGSGGGSPAIPLAVALDARHLAMVESRGRKAAFLREAARELGLSASVYADRIEALATRPELRGEADIVSVRAIRLDPPMLAPIRALLAATGQLALFVTEAPNLPHFAITATHELAGRAKPFLVLASPG